MDDDASLPEDGVADGRHELISRESLFEQVWARPMLRVAEQYGVSSSYLTRVCVELRVPRPPPGYWTQVSFGRVLERPELPVARTGDVLSWCPGAAIGNAEREAKKSEQRGGAPQAKRAKALSESRSRSPPPVSKLHPLLHNVKPLFLKTRVTDNGLLRPYKRLLVDVSASKEHLDEALELANSIFCALTGRGHRVALGAAYPQMKRADVVTREAPTKNRFLHQAWAPDRPTVLYLGAAAIGLALFEITEDVDTVYANGGYVRVSELTLSQQRQFVGPHHWTSKAEVPSGRFCVLAYCPTSTRVQWSKRWSETNGAKLSTRISTIVKELEASVPELMAQIEVARLQQERDQQEWAEKQRMWREQSERDRQDKAHKAARQELLEAIAVWNEAKQVEAYFDDVLLAVQELEGNERKALMDRVAQARALVGESRALDSLKRWKSVSERLTAPDR